MKQKAYAELAEAALLDGPVSPLLRSGETGSSTGALGSTNGITMHQWEPLAILGDQFLVLYSQVSSMSGRVDVSFRAF